MNFDRLLAYDNTDYYKECWEDELGEIIQRGQPPTPSPNHLTKQKSGGGDVLKLLKSVLN